MVKQTSGIKNLVDLTKIDWMIEMTNLSPLVPRVMCSSSEAGKKKVVLHENCE